MGREDSFRWGFGVLRGVFREERCLRLGVSFADGWKTAAVEAHPPGGEEPAGPFMVPRGGGGGGDEWRSRLWLWPLPPPGPLTWVVAWADESIHEQSTTVDASELIAAAEKAEQLWSAEPLDEP